MRENPLVAEAQPFVFIKRRRGRLRSTAICVYQRTAVSWIQASPPESRETPRALERLALSFLSFCIFHSSCLLSISAFGIDKSRFVRSENLLNSFLLIIATTIDFIEPLLK